MAYRVVVVDKRHSESFIGVSFASSTEGLERQPFCGSQLQKSVAQLPRWFLLPSVIPIPVNPNCPYWSACRKLASKVRPLYRGTVWVSPVWREWPNGRYETDTRRSTPVTRGHPPRGFIKQTDEDHEKEQVNRTWNRLQGGALHDARAEAAVAVNEQAKRVIGYAVDTRTNGKILLNH